MSFDAQRLYELLPAIYRIRDAEQRGTLHALLEVIAGEIGVVEENLDQLYDDQFIETCADWVVPYLGDLIGVRVLHGVTSRVSSPRAEVANTIRLRRRKGTAVVLEELARDVTGWPARVVEFFEWLGWTQFMNHTRAQPPRGGWLDLRDHDACERIVYARGAFDSVGQTVDVRRIASARGRYNIPNVGLFLWRLQSYPITGGQTRLVGSNRFTFNPLGLDAPLFNHPQTEAEITHLAEEINLPAPLRRRPLYDELEARRQALAESRAPDAVYFGDQPVCEVRLSNETKPVAPEELMICDLSDWRTPPDSRDYTLPDGSKVSRKICAAIDPVLGRLTFAAAEKPEAAIVSYSYGFSDEMGSGPYNRLASVSAALDRPVTWQVGVSKEIAPAPNQIFATLQEAVDAWNAQEPGAVGVIAILDSRTYTESLTADHKILIPAGSRLLMVAADWPEVGLPKQRVKGQLSPAGRRPHLLGGLSVVGMSDGSGTGELILNGLLIEGVLTVLVGALDALGINHCTLAPGVGSIVVNASGTDPEKQNALLKLSLDHSVCGPITLPETVTHLRVADSIVSSGDGDDATSAIAAPGAEAELERSDFFGAVAARGVEASDCIFTGVLEAARRQFGCVRFSYLPLGSRAPRRYRSRPENEAEAVRVRPQFRSRRYGDPDYAQLSQRTAIEIRQGASDEAEMGAFHDLFQPQRETNLRVRLNEYLRLGLEAGIIYVT
ncbi:MAG TPA: hypothetical protein VKD91_00470 [Pyrinomonadaceae bacterium]|nr:hypothetical protein [Pyrinomonadaceae bacterium]